MSGRDWFLLWLLSLCWGASFFFVEIALTGFAPFALTFGRIGIAAVMLGALLAAHGVSLRAVLGRWRVYAPVGFFGNALPFTAFAWGQQYIDSGLAGVLNATTPIFTLILAAIIGEERATAPRVGGILLGFVGVCVLLSPAVGDPGERFLLGALAPITAGCAYGVAVLWARRRAGGFAPAENAFGQLTFATAMLLPLAAIESAQNGFAFARAPGEAWAAIFAIAFFSTYCAYLIYYRLLASAGAVNTILVTFLIPINAVALGAFVLGEVFDLAFFGGAGLILASLLVIDPRLRGAIWARLGGRRG